MKPVFALALAALVASPAVAGDQPVILPMPTIGVVDYLGPPEVRFDTVATPTAGPVPTSSGAVQAATPGGNGTGAFGLGHVASDDLYARLLEEARSRGLR